MAVEDKKGQSPEEEKFRFVPLDGSNCDLETLEALAEDSKVSVIDPEAFAQLYRKYGSKEQLQRVFEEQVGYMNGVDKVRSQVEDTAKELGGVVVGGSVVVMDKKGEGGKLRAYNWPYVGVRGDWGVIEIPRGIVEQIKKAFEDKGIKPERITDFKTEPRTRGDKGHVVAVFLGKE